MIRLKHVTEGHYVADADSCYMESLSRFSRSARSLLRDCNAATDAVIATDNGKLVGFARWYDDGDVVSAGTWVDPRYRRRGLAKRMWRLALRHIEDEDVVEIVTISKAGRRLALAMERESRKVVAS